MQQQANKVSQKKESRLPVPEESASAVDSFDANQHPLQQKIAGSDEVTGRRQKINNLHQSIQRKENHTGMSDNLKSGLEGLSGYDLSHVRVHFNSSKPAQLNALAYAQGSDIHLGPGQEKHLPHEGWHIVQQLQGRVRPTAQLKRGTPINDDASLEAEATHMGTKAISESPAKTDINLRANQPPAGNVVQRLIGFEFETSVPLKEGDRERALFKDKVLLKGGGWSLTSETAHGAFVVEFKVRAIDDQSDPAVLEAAMTELEACVNIIATANKPVTIQELAAQTGASMTEEHKDTTVIPIGDPIGARPQMTAGIALDKLTNLVADLAVKDTQLKGGPTKSAQPSPMQRRIAKTGAAADQYFRSLRGTRPKTYEGFIALLTSYINGILSVDVPEYFKAAIPALSRANLGQFMAIKEISDRRDQIIKDVTSLTGVNPNDPLFPSGYMEQGKLTKDDTGTIGKWLTSIIKGEDGIAWSTQLNQKGEPFALEEVGPKPKDGKKQLGVPIEIRSLQQDIPHFGWKPFALHLFSYASSLNTSENPAPYKNLPDEQLTKRQGAPVAAREPLERKSAAPAPKKEAIESKKQEKPPEKPVAALPPKKQELKKELDKPIAAIAPRKVGLAPRKSIVAAPPKKEESKKQEKEKPVAVAASKDDHEERAAKITDYLLSLDDIGSLPEPQQTWLSNHKWNDDPVESVNAFAILKLPNDWESPQHKKRVDKITEYVFQNEATMTEKDKQWLIAHNTWATSVAVSMKTAAYLKLLIQ